MSASVAIADGVVAPKPARVLAVLDHPGASATVRDGFVHRAILGLVFVAFCCSGFVFSEPAPVDVLILGLMLLLPAAALVTFPPLLGFYLAVWAVSAASELLASTLSRDMGASALFTAVSIYLIVASFIVAGFVAKAPVRHTQIILKGWLVAALVAAVLGLAGVFRLVPGAFELFTKFERAAGTFKDPNVFGPFLVPPFLYLLHVALQRSFAGGVCALAGAAVLGLGVVMSSSRGAWINLVFALALYGLLSYVTAGSHRMRRRIVWSLVGAVAVAGVGLALVLQDPKFAEFLSARASLTQSYDVGPSGRFGGQEKAIRLLLDHPFGIGATQFTSVHHHEEVHNVFLSMFLNAGWLGGLTYLAMVVSTIGLGFSTLARGSAARPLMLIALSAFTATAFEGLIIDTDHWRSFYFLMAIVWGIAASPADRRTLP